MPTERDELLAETHLLREERDRWREYCEAETAALGVSKAENQRLREEVAFLRERQIKLLALAGDGE